MKHSRCKIVAIILLFVSSCVPQGIQRETPTPYASEATASMTATLHSEPALTIMPTVSFDGPRLVYQGDPAVYMMYFDGAGKKKLNLPSDFVIQYLEQNISPDGKWIAFHTGSEENKDIALNLFSIETGESILITSLLSPDYPHNFQKAFDRIQTSQKVFFNKGAISSAMFELGFDLTMVSWSPDSRFLAFAGEMDGPTSDLYLYDMESQTIRRMFDDLLNLGSLEWADDGQVIFFSNIVPGEIYSWHIYYAIDVENGHVQEFDVAGWDIIDTCFESESCFWHYQGDGGDPNNISLLDTASGKSKTIWGSTFQDYAISLPDKLIIVSGPYAEEPEPGTYFVDFAGKRKKISDIFFERFIYWDAEDACFIGAVPDGLYRISLDGTIRKISETVYYEFSASPDGKWLIAYSGTGLLLFDSQLKVVRLIGGGSIENLVWQPDSSGLFFATKDLYHVSIPEGELQLVEENTDVNLGEYNHRWIP
ncbi:MAG TPA: hypothetical protein VHP14_00490 [Anaerolineales bacterium]|nr:hypothetical protein [Anaerolineales bacterium]